jgi:hypothetical protein
MPKTVQLMITCLLDTFYFETGEAVVPSGSCAGMIRQLSLSNEKGKSSLSLTC